ncbi:hypothetical protein HD599_000347 [Conyzicola lurida]|uniref:Uncharacterized protein n=1 Tax=Conyzicola lurida TaxID=1172621 RepID=A0A841AHX2_9MICO|nr:hypothetical protein [Conyzicola lurida]MBB5842024.1 hypothetical protein [Conyzicola lurida]
MTTTDSAAGDALLLALTDVIRGAASPEIQQAQAMLLRRLATQGDVIPSRVPAPLNITEVGGYFNLLSTLGEDEMRTAMLGSALGLATETTLAVAGGEVPPMHLTSIPNQRPEGEAGAGVPLAVGVRQDLAPSLAAALAGVRAAGGLLPLWTPPALPGPGGLVTSPLPFLGREVWIAPSVATVDPENDPVILGRAATDATAGYRLGVRVADGTPDAPKLAWTGLVWDEAGGVFVERALGDISVLPIETVLAPTPFSATRIAVAPTGRGDYAWARLVAPGGLVAGVSTLGDELALLYTPDRIASSAFATRLDAVWNGSDFVG